jgi:hypothetical protein
MCPTISPLTFPPGTKILERSGIEKQLARVLADNKSDALVDNFAY